MAIMPNGTEEEIKARKEVSDRVRVYFYNTWKVIDDLDVFIGPRLRNVQALLSGVSPPPSGKLSRVNNSRPSARSKSPVPVSAGLSSPKLLAPVSPSASTAPPPRRRSPPPQSTSVDVPSGNATSSTNVYPLALAVLPRYLILIATLSSPKMTALIRCTAPSSPWSSSQRSKTRFSSGCIPHKRRGRVLKSGRLRLGTWTAIFVTGGLIGNHPHRHL